MVIERRRPTFVELFNMSEMRAVFHALVLVMTMFCMFWILWHQTVQSKRGIKNKDSWPGEAPALAASTAEKPNIMNDIKDKKAHKFWHLPIAYEV